LFAIFRLIRVGRQSLLNKLVGSYLISWYKYPSPWWEAIDIKPNAWTIRFKLIYNAHVSFCFGVIHVFCPNPVRTNMARHFTLRVNEESAVSKYSRVSTI
jgi:hypothetical protein